MNARFWLAFGSWAALAVAQTAYPPATPFLRIETGMPTEIIRGIDVDASERFLVTASEDKTARVWDLKDGKLLQVLRPPQGSGNEGKLYAVAISPDGTTVAVGGLTGNAGAGKSVYLFDRARGALTRSISGFPDVILHLSYSADGRYLAVALGEANGIRVYRSSDYSEAARDTGYGDHCEWAEFDRTARLVTASLDGFVRLYGENFRLIAKKEAPGGKEPMSARFSPDGSKVAVGFDDTAAVNILSGRDLSFLSSPETPLEGGNFGNVAWSRDGQTLYAAGTYMGASQTFEMLSWASAIGKPTYWPASTDSITSVRPLSSGRVAFGTADAAVGLLGREGDLIWQHMRDALDYRPPADVLRLSPDGGALEFGFFSHSPQRGWLPHVGRFEPARRQISLDASPDPTLSAPRTAGLGIKDWYNTEHPTLDGHTLTLERHEISRSLAISAKGDSFLLGSDWWLRLFDSSGSLGWEAPVPGAAWAVNLTPDGRYAVAALGDGTIRWYRADNGQEVMGLFVDPDGKRWVLWTPEGFYDSSENADELIGYHLNHGPDHEGEFVRVEQLKKLFYRPDILAQRLKPDGDKLVREELARTGDVSKILHSGSPPELALLSPAETESDGSFTLQFRITDRGAGIGRVIYRIDGTDVDGRPLGPLPGKDTVGRVFDLAPGKHTVSASVFDGSNRLESRSISTVVNVRASNQQTALYVVAVGITNYRDHELNKGVRFAAADADILATRLKQQGKGLFRDVIAQVLPDAQATRDNIEKTLKDLAGRIQPADEFILYLAGHGTSIGGEYTFIPWDAVYSNEDELHKASLGEERLQSLLRLIPANKTLLLLDTCNAGAAIFGRDLSDKGSIERLSKLTGRVILAASSTDQMALEGYENHGVFTYAVLDGLANASDDNGLIQVTTLADRIQNLVPDITKKRWGYEQFPMRLIQGETFPIARKQ